jgi:hypothetical protein
VIEDEVRNLSDSSPCPGDSGGPLVRTGLTMTVNGGTTRTGLEAIVGVASAGNALCQHHPMLPYVSGIWTLVNADANHQFIESTLKRWRPYVRLHSTQRDVGGTGPEVEEWWGAPCNSDANCPSTEYCSQPARSFSYRTSCSACDLPFPQASPDDCSCIQGQCLPK